MPSKKVGLICALVLSMRIAFGGDYTPDVCDACDPRFVFAMIPNVQYTGGRGRSYNGGYSSIETFLALYDRYFHSYPYMDVHINRLDNGTYASNIGTGFRYFTTDSDHMIGLNLYYDRREVKQETLQQMSLGLELLGPCWDIRGNGYWPVGKNQAFVDPLLYNYPGGFTATGEEFLGTMWGVDIEVGKWLFSYKGTRFYGAFGPYFYGSACCQSIVGVMGRLEAWICNSLRIEGVILHDRLFGTNVQGALYFYLTFPCSLRNCWLCRFPPVIRNPIIVLEQLCCWEQVF